MRRAESEERTYGTWTRHLKRMDLSHFGVGAYLFSLPFCQKLESLFHFPVLPATVSFLWSRFFWTNWVDLLLRIYHSLSHTCVQRKNGQRKRREMERVNGKNEAGRVAGVPRGFSLLFSDGYFLSSKYILIHSTTTVALNDLSYTIPLPFLYRAAPPSLLLDDANLSPGIYHTNR